VRGWIGLGASTAAITTAFHLLSVPAALLLGPMLAGIAVAARGRDLTLPRWTSVAGQSVVGCLIATGMAGALGPVVREHWALFAGLGLATIAASGALGYALDRLRVVPGTVAIWGSMPGGAAAMVLMAEADGADPRMVAVMVYTRVVVVTIAATALAALAGATSHGGLVEDAAATTWTMPAVALAGAASAVLLRWPAGTLIMTMALGVAAQAAGLGAPRVPPPLLVAAFAAIGWRIGLSFTGEARGAALRMLPRIVVAALALSAFSGLLALAMHLALGVDPLTAWLAASPGGLESVAVIAGTTEVDTPFVMAAQSARFGLVMLVGPALATALSRRIRRRMVEEGGGSGA
jgi:membrane AbrB-like protein